jgi:hypothetical protein
MKAIVRSALFLLGVFLLRGTSVAQESGGTGLTSSGCKKCLSGPVGGGNYKHFFYGDPCVAGADTLCRKCTSSNPCHTNDLNFRCEYWHVICGHDFAEVSKIKSAVANKDMATLVALVKKNPRYLKINDKKTEVIGTNCRGTIVMRFPLTFASTAAKVEKRTRIFSSVTT